jgi:hypothetical protein
MFRSVFYGIQFKISCIIRNEILARSRSHMRIQKMDNINTLSLKELKELQLQVVKAIATFEDRKKKIALVELQEMARAKGFTLEELTGVSVVRRRSPAVAILGLAVVASRVGSCKRWLRAIRRKICRCNSGLALKIRKVGPRVGLFFWPCLSPSAPAKPYAAL